jgi:SAM-dependent methyltransferase
MGIADDVYGRLANEYVEHARTSPYNQYVERPAMLSLAGDVGGARVLDLGCAGGFFSGWAIDHGAQDVLGVDASKAMVAVTAGFTSGRARTSVANLEEPWAWAPDQSFDVAIASLVFHSIEDWSHLFRELRRVVRAGGRVIFSVGNPVADWEKSEGRDYHGVELLNEYWPALGVTVPCFRRSLSAVFESVLAEAFRVTALVEPRPVSALAEVDPALFDELTRKPTFVCVRLEAPGTATTKGSRA